MRRWSRASRCSSAACGRLAHAEPHLWSTGCTASQLRAVARGAQEQAKQALAESAPGAAAMPEARRTGLGKALQHCLMWHMEHRVAGELHWYSCVPRLLEQMRRKLAQEVQPHLQAGVKARVRLLGRL